MKEFVKIYGNNLPITQRVDPKTLDSVITKELKIRGITAKFGYGVIDKNNNLQALPIKPIKRKKTTIPTVILFLPIKRIHYTVLLWFSLRKNIPGHE
jgi:two-component system phosphate regulon sensor histidine kinase PhoR